MRIIKNISLDFCPEFVYNKGMDQLDKSKMIKTTVVDIFNSRVHAPQGVPDMAHFIVTLRRMDDRYPDDRNWYTICVHPQVLLAWFDIVFLDMATNSAYVERGPLLVYRLDTNCSPDPEILAEFETFFSGLLEGKQ